MHNANLVAAVGGTLKLCRGSCGCCKVHAKDLNRKVRAHGKRIISAELADLGFEEDCQGCLYCMDAPYCEGFTNGCDCPDCIIFAAYQANLWI